MRSVEITYITGPHQAGKTLMAACLYRDFAPRFPVIWFDEDYRSAGDMGASDISKLSSPGQDLDRVIISSEDSALLAQVIRMVEDRGYTHTVRIVRCEALVRG